MVQVASSSTTQLAYAEETTYGVIPKNGKNLRMTGETMEQTISKEVSAEINATRQTAGMFLTDAQVSGGFNFELSAKEFDPLFEAFLMDDWKDINNATAVLDFVAGSNELTVAGVVLDPKDFMYAWIRPTVTDQNDPNNKAFLITKVEEAGADTKITLAGKLAKGTYTGFTAKRLTNGVKKRSFTFCKDLPEVAQTFVFKGMRAGKFTLNCESKAAITGSFDFIGSSMEVKDKIPFTKTEDSFANPIMDGVLGMDTVFLNGEDIRDSYTAGVKQVTLEYDNNLQGLDAVGTLGNVEVMVGSISCTGTASMYFASAQAYEDTIKQKRFSLAWTMFDHEGNAYGITLPSIEFNDPKAPVSAKDQPVMIDLSFQAMMHPTLKKTIIISAA